MVLPRRGALALLVALRPQPVAAVDCSGRRVWERAREGAHSQLRAPLDPFKHEGSMPQSSALRPSPRTLHARNLVGSSSEAKQVHALRW